METSEFTHLCQIRVRTYDIDSQGIVHNLNFLKYFETGRVEYFRNLGYNLLPTGIFNIGLKVVVVRNEIDYLSFAFLDDLLDIYTKISWIKKTSFCFDQIIKNNKSGITVCKGMGILVNVNSQNKPEKIYQNIISEIELFEKKTIKIIDENEI
ncbi:MAG: acyl-CoA thioesterase [Ignavibacteria bacterium]|nr:acyl-CoA thioesterase [Ignavibacteria bacterium]